MRCDAGLLALLAATGCLDAPPGATAGARCGTTRALRGDFEATSPDWEVYGQAGVTGGHALLYAAAGQQSGMSSTWAYQHAGGEMIIELGAIDMPPDASFYAGLIDGDDDATGIQLAGGTLSIVVEIGGERTEPFSMAFDPGMTWWRLSETDGDLHLATSSNSGETWADHAAVPDQLQGPAWALFSTAADTVQASVAVESVNLTAEPEGLCPIASLVDDFSARSPRWFVLEGAGCGVATEGALVITYDGDAGCGLGSMEQFDLRNGAVEIEVVDPGDCDPVASVAVDLESVSLELLCENVAGVPRLRARAIGGDGPIALVDFDPGERRRWRMQHDPAQDGVAFQTAPGEGGWTQIGVAAIEEAELAAASVWLTAIDDTVGDGAATIVMDNLNR